MITLLLFYVCCREFDVSPFIEEDEDKHFGLKISAFLYLVGGLLYLYSWNFWGREYSHFIIAVLPALMLAIESKNRVISRNEIIFFALNLVGMFILFAIPDSIKPITLVGFAISLVGVALLFAGFIKMGQSQGNFLSMGIVYNLFIVIFVPAFFAIQAGTPPNIIEVLAIMILGILSFFGIVLAIRSSQLSKHSHCLLFASLGLVSISLVRGFKSDGFTFTCIIGTILSFFGGVMILINQSTKTELVGQNL